MKRKQVKAKDIIGFISTLDEWYQDQATVEQLTSTKLLLRMGHPMTKHELVNRLCDYLTDKGMSYSTLRVFEIGKGLFRISTTDDLKTLTKIRLDNDATPKGARKCSDKKLLTLVSKHYPNILSDLKDEYMCSQTKTHYFIETSNKRYSFKKIFNNGSKTNTLEM
jgi:hypothetical protein